MSATKCMSTCAARYSSDVSGGNAKSQTGHLSMTSPGSPPALHRDLKLLDLYLGEVVNFPALHRHLKLLDFYLVCPEKWIGENFPEIFPRKVKGQKGATGSN